MTDLVKYYHYSEKEKELLHNIIKRRRDVRDQFLERPINENHLMRILDAAHHAPSVGLSVPWHFHLINHNQIKKEIYNLFKDANHKSSKQFSGEKQKDYLSLKLEGILKAPLLICVTCENDVKPILGTHQMPETRAYSTVCAIQNMWLTAHVENIGMGWVSIIDPIALSKLLTLPNDHKIIGLFCLGYIEEQYIKPELEVKKWAEYPKLEDHIHREAYDTSYFK